MKSSRERILATIANHKPPQASLPEVGGLARTEKNLPDAFTKIAVNIGSRVFPVKDFAEITGILQKEFTDAKRIMSNVAGLSYSSAETPAQTEADPHNYRNVDLAILEGKLGVAENSAIWLSEKEMGHRVLPFICQHLALVIKKAEIVANMHEAYDRLETMEEGFGTFIAGPSKTADIEQSLVLGAHGPRSLTIFILE